MKKIIIFLIIGIFLLIFLNNINATDIDLSKISGLLGDLANLGNKLNTPIQNPPTPANQETPINFQSDNQRIDISDKLGLSEGKVFIQGSKSDKIKLIKNGDLVSIEGEKDSSWILIFTDKDGKELMRYGAKKSDFPQKMVLKKGQLTEGSDFLSDGASLNGDKKDGAKIVVNGYEYTFHEGDRIGIKDNRMTVLTSQDIIRPKKITGVQSDGKFIAEYKTQDKEVKFSDGSQKGISVKGSLSFRGETAIHESGKSLVYGKVEFKDSEKDPQAKETTIISKVPESRDKIPKVDSYIIADSDKGVLEVGASKDKTSPSLIIAKENEFVPYSPKDDLKRVLVLRANCNDPNGCAISLTKEANDIKPTLKFIGVGAEADIDNHHLKNKGDDLYFYEKGSRLVSGAEGSSTFPMKIIFTKSDGITKTNNFGFDFHVNAHNQGAAIPQGYKFDDKNGFYISPKQNIPLNPYLKYNYLIPEMQIKISGLTKELFSKLEPDGFFEKNLQDKQKYLDDLLKSTKPIPPPSPPVPPPNTPTPPQPGKKIDRAKLLETLKKTEPKDPSKLKGAAWLGYKLGVKTLYDQISFIKEYKTIMDKHLSPGSTTTDEQFKEDIYTMFLKEQGKMIDKLPRSQQTKEGVRAMLQEQRAEFTRQYPDLIAEFGDVFIPSKEKSDELLDKLCKSKGITK